MDKFLFLVVFCIFTGVLVSDAAVVHGKPNADEMTAISFLPNEQHAGGISATLSEPLEDNQAVKSSFQQPNKKRHKTIDTHSDDASSTYKSPTSYASFSDAPYTFNADEINNNQGTFDPNNLLSMYLGKASFSSALDQTASQAGYGGLAPQSGWHPNYGSSSSSVIVMSSPTGSTASQQTSAQTVNYPSVMTQSFPGYEQRQHQQQPQQQQSQQHQKNVTAPQLQVIPEETQEQLRQIQELQRQLNVAQLQQQQQQQQQHPEEQESSQGQSRSHTQPRDQGQLEAHQQQQQQQRQQIQQLNVQNQQQQQVHLNSQQTQLPAKTLQNQVVQGRNEQVNERNPPVYENQSKATPQRQDIKQQQPRLYQMLQPQELANSQLESMARPAAQSDPNWAENFFQNFRSSQTQTESKLQTTESETNAGKPQETYPAAQYSSGTLIPSSTLNQNPFSIWSQMLEITHTDDRNSPHETTGFQAQDPGDSNSRGQGISQPELPGTQNTGKELSISSTARQPYDAGYTYVFNPEIVNQQLTPLQNFGLGIPSPSHQFTDTKENNTANSAGSLTSQQTAASTGEQFGTFNPDTLNVQQGILALFINRQNGDTYQSTFDPDKVNARQEMQTNFINNLSNQQKFGFIPSAMDTGNQMNQASPLLQFESLSNADSTKGTENERTVNAAQLAGTDTESPLYNLANNPIRMDEKMQDYRSGTEHQIQQHAYVPNTMADLTEKQSLEQQIVAFREMRQKIQTRFLRPDGDRPKIRQSRISPNEDEGDSIKSTGLTVYDDKYLRKESKDLLNPKKALQKAMKTEHVDYDKSKKPASYAHHVQDSKKMQTKSSAINSKPSLSTLTSGGNSNLVDFSKLSYMGESLQQMLNWTNPILSNLNGTGFEALGVKFGPPSQDYNGVGTQGTSGLVNSGSMPFTGTQNNQGVNFGPPYQFPESGASPSVDFASGLTFGSPVQPSQIGFGSPVLQSQTGFGSAVSQSLAGLGSDVQQSQTGYGSAFQQSLASLGFSLPQGQPGFGQSIRQGETGSGLPFSFGQGLPNQGSSPNGGLQFGLSTVQQVSGTNQGMLTNLGTQDFPLNTAFSPLQNDGHGLSYDLNSLPYWNAFGMSPRNSGAMTATARKSATVQNANKDDQGID